MEIRVICAQCGKEFAADRRNKKYCSSDCYQKRQCEEKSRAWAEKHAKELEERKKTAIETVKDCKHKNCACRSKMSNRAIETCDYLLITKKPGGARYQNAISINRKQRAGEARCKIGERGFNRIRRRDAPLNRASAVN